MDCASWPGFWGSELRLCGAGQSPALGQPWGLRGLLVIPAGARSFPLWSSFQGVLQGLDQPLSTPVSPFLPVQPLEHIEGVFPYSGWRVNFKFHNLSCNSFVFLQHFEVKEELPRQKFGPADYSSFPGRGTFPGAGNLWMI